MFSPSFVRASAFAALLASLLVSSSRARASAHQVFEDEAEEAAAARVARDERWDGANDPTDWEKEGVGVARYAYELSQLPLAGAMADHTPWSDTYWPTNQAGIAARWNWEGFNGFSYRTFDESAVRAMKPAELARLSPAEKYDIFMGRFDYPTVSMIRGGTSKRAEYWSGICHGWSPASLNHAEPAPVTVKGPGGIAVPFGSADVKALLDEYYADHAQATAFMGLKCQAGQGGNVFRRIATPFIRGSAACQDVNAGAFHLVLANELGIRKRGFVADVERWREVWNQPVYAYTSKIVGYRSPSKGSAYGTVKEAVVRTEMRYVDEIDAKWNPVVGTRDFKDDVMKYEYTLELDSAGRVIGGDWISAERPDFLWSAPRLQFTGHFSGINQIYRPFVAAPSPVPSVVPAAEAR